jgi:hypothetical protein
VVDVGIGNDLRGRDRSSRDLRTRPRLWRNRLREQAAYLLRLAEAELRRPREAAAPRYQRLRISSEEGVTIRPSVASENPPDAS